MVLRNNTRLGLLITCIKAFPRGYHNYVTLAG